MTEREQLLARVAAKKFASRLKTERWAEPIPMEWEKLSDEQVRYAIEVLPQFGVHRRPDLKWEASW
jgi:hypothetical protein